MHPFFAPASEFQKNRKSENQKIRSLRSDFRAGTTLVQNTEMGSVNNSFFEEHNFRDAATSGTNHRNVSAQEFLICRNFDSSVPVAVGQR